MPSSRAPNGRFIRKNKEMDAVFEELKKVDATAVRDAIERYGSDSHQRDYGRIFTDLNGHPRPSCVVYADKHRNGSVDRNGDLLVGFYAAEAPTRFSLEIGGSHVCTHALAKGEFAFAIEGRFVAPLICLRFHDVRTHGPATQCLCVLASLQSDTRLEMARSGRLQCRLDEGSYFQIMCGMSQTDARSFDGPFIELPDLSSKIDYAGLSVERTRVILEDLAKTTWHPSRIRRWYLEHDDEFFECCDDGSSSKVFLDEGVLLMDDFIPDELRGLVAAASMASSSPRLCEIPGVLQAIQTELFRRRMTSLIVVGTKVTYGMTDSGGMHRHVDGSLQGGEFSLVVYLDCCEESGRIVFCESGMKIKPKKGRCVVFDVHALHETEPSGGRRVFLACECVYH